MTERNPSKSLHTHDMYTDSVIKKYNTHSTWNTWMKEYGHLNKQDVNYRRKMGKCHDVSILLGKKLDSEE